MHSSILSILWLQFVTICLFHAITCRFIRFFGGLHIRYCTAIRMMSSVLKHTFLTSNHHLAAEFDSDDRYHVPFPPLQFARLGLRSRFSFRRITACNSHPLARLCNFRGRSQTRHPLWNACGLRVEHRSGCRHTQNRSVFGFP